MSSYQGLNQANAATYFLDRNVEAGRGDEVALYYLDQSTSYSQLFDLVCRAGNLFVDSGIDYENRVVIILPDSPIHVVALLGLIRIGAVPVPLSTRLSLDDYLYVFADCRPKGLIIGQEHVSVMESVQRQLEENSFPFPKNTWVVGSGQAPSHYRPLEDALSQTPNESFVRKSSRDEPALIQYTSGRTGKPKGVVHLHRGLLQVTGHLARRLGMSEADKCFSVAKLSFGYGLGNSVLLPFSLGACSILHPGLADPFTIYELLIRHRPTVFFGVPSLYSAMLQVKVGETDFDPSSLRVCVSAGEHLSASLFYKWKERFGHEILDGLGSTECLHIFVSGEIGRIKPGSVGTPIEGCEAKLLDDDGERVNEGETGHLYVKSPANAARYWNKHDETTATMIGAWIRTGDLLYQDDEGYYYYVGRSDDVIKVGGLKVSPIEVEECLLTFECVKECAVAGVTTKEGIATIQAYVCLNEGWEPSRRLKRVLKEYVQNSISPYKCPKEIEFVPALPKTVNGKIARYRLSEVAAV
ncbi:MAG: benzoate-CoA ligase family protein [Blastocatellia bacterium]